MFATCTIFLDYVTYYVTQVGIHAKWRKLRFIFWRIRRREGMLIFLDRLLLSISYFPCMLFRKTEGNLWSNNKAETSLFAYYSEEFPTFHLEWQHIYTEIVRKKTKVFSSGEYIFYSSFLCLIGTARSINPLIMASFEENVSSLPCHLELDCYCFCILSAFTIYKANLMPGCFWWNAQWGKPNYGDGLLEKAIRILL